MAATSLSLIVLRAASPDALTAFYMNLGMTFVKHRHGSGPEHHSAELAHGVVFEIYPLRSGEAPAIAARIGFCVESVIKATAALAEAGARMVSEPKASEWGLRAVLDDPEGHRIELTERKMDAEGPSALQSN